MLKRQRWSRSKSSKNDCEHRCFQTSRRKPVHTRKPQTVAVITAFPFLTFDFARIGFRRRSAVQRGLPSAGIKCKDSKKKKARKEKRDGENQPMSRSLKLFQTSPRGDSESEESSRPSSPTNEGGLQAGITTPEVPLDEVDARIQVIKLRLQQIKEQDEKLKGARTSGPQ